MHVSMSISGGCKIFGVLAKFIGGATYDVHVAERKSYHSSKECKKAIQFLPSNKDGQKLE